MTNFIHELRKNTKMASEFFAEKLAYTLGPVELKNMMQEDKIKLIDVRYKDDFKEDHIENSINIEKDELESKFSELSKGQLYAVMCYNQQCHLGASMAYKLAKNGFMVMEVEGGFKAWSEDFKFETV